MNSAPVSNDKNKMTIQFKKFGITSTVNCLISKIKSNLKIIKWKLSGYK